MGGVGGDGLIDWEHLFTMTLCRAAFTGRPNAGELKPVCKPSEWFFYGEPSRGTADSFFSSCFDSSAF